MVSLLRERRVGPQVGRFTERAFQWTLRTEGKDICHGEGDVRLARSWANHGLVDWKDKYSLTKMKPKLKAGESELEKEICFACVKKEKTWYDEKEHTD